jgi:P pilus assembly chaperone PapD
MRGLRATLGGLLLAWALTMVATPASAQLVVDKLWVDLDTTSTGRSDVVLKNESADRYYVSVAAVEMVRPGSADEERVVRSNPEELGLLVSPSRLVLDPGTTRAIRIVSINPELAVERIYRIRVTPEVGEVQAGEAAAEERGISLKVLTAYDLLIVARPANPEARLVAARGEGELVLTNQGNTNTLLLDGKACVAAPEGERCEVLPDRRLYAGGEWRIPLPAPGAKVSFRERGSVGAEDKILEF